MCKHVAAALYGVGARLDEAPQLLFVLRGVDEGELLAGAGQDLAVSKPAPAAAKLLDDDDVAALFGLEMAEDGPSHASPPVAAKPLRRARTTTASKGTGPEKTARNAMPHPTRGKTAPARKAKRPGRRKSARGRQKPS